MFPLLSLFIQSLLKLMLNKTKSLLNQDIASDLVSERQGISFDLNMTERVGQEKRKRGGES